MRSRVLVAFVLLAGSALIPTPAAAHPPGLDREVRQILRDCARDDHLDRDYSRRALRAALRRMPDDIRYYTGCERAIRRALRRAGHQNDLAREVRQILRDCSRDDHLDRQYSRRALRAALRRMPDDIREYTDCERVIRRALRRAGHHRPGHEGHGQRGNRG